MVALHVHAATMRTFRRGLVLLSASALPIYKKPSLLDDKELLQAKTTNGYQGYPSSAPVSEIAGRKVGGRVVPCLTVPGVPYKTPPGSHFQIFLDFGQKPWK